ncbi:MAG: CHAP domain-containing protein [Clostridia bacterium]|nr:CHAP domain-containing protein [Clostridia bacterium]
MTRYYDSDYVQTLRDQISSIRQDINPNSYGIGYYGSLSSSESSYAKTCADNAAAAASLRATEFRDKLQTLGDKITNYYNGVDGISEEIYSSALNLSTVLNEALKTMTEAESLLSHSTELNDLTPCSVSNVFDRIHKAKVKCAAEYVKELMRSSGSLDETAASWLKDYLHGNGLKDVTDDDLHNFLLINDYLIRHGHSVEWITDRMEIIIASQWFDDIKVTGRYSGKDQALCLKYLEEYLSKKNVECIKYNLLVNGLRGENGTLDQKVLESYRRFIAKKGVNTLSDEYIKGYLQTMESFKKAGISDELLYENFVSFYENNNFKMIYYVGTKHGASQTAAINSIIDDFVKAGFNKQLEMDNEISKRFIDVLYSNTTLREQMSILDYFGRLDRGESIPLDEKLDFTMRFARCFLGYEDIEPWADFQETYFGELYEDSLGRKKQGAGWCAMFVSWMISKGGLLDGSIVEDVTPENAIPEYYWADAPGYRTVFRANEHYAKAVDYTPCNGDLILFREYWKDEINIYHVGIVLGVDVENKKVYTIEGNVGGAQGTEAEERHGIHIKSYDMDWERIGGYCKMDGTERNMRMIAGYEDQVVENYFEKELYVACSDGFVMNDE